MGKKYIIELEDKPIGNGLWKVRGFNSLVFDQNGLNKLKEYHEECRPGSIVKTSCGTELIVFSVTNGIIEGFDHNMKWHCVEPRYVAEVVGFNHDVHAFAWRNQ